MKVLLDYVRLILLSVMALLWSELLFSLQNSKVNKKWTRTMNYNFFFLVFICKAATKEDEARPRLFLLLCFHLSVSFLPLHSFGPQMTNRLSHVAFFFGLPFQVDHYLCFELLCKWGCLLDSLFPLLFLPLGLGFGILLIIFSQLRKHIGAYSKALPPWVRQCVVQKFKE